MTKDEELIFDGKLAAMGVALNFSLMSVIAAAMEAKAIDPDRVIAWANFFAERCEADSRAQFNGPVAESLRAFSQLLKEMCVLPEGSGLA